MVSRNAIQDIAARAEAHRHNLATEEATKNALIMPMLQAIGYDVFDPEEVVPEFTAAHGVRSGEKVDYAIIRDGAPVMLVECKKVGAPLNADRESQLARYFVNTPARIGILTDGIIYKFYTDLDRENLMDSDPFLEIDITNIGQRQIQMLGHFAKHTFNVDEARSVASDMKHIAGIKGNLAQMYNQPDEDFVRLLARRVFSGSLSRPRMEHFTEVVRLAFHEFVNELMSDTLRRATEMMNSVDAAPDDADSPDESEADVTESASKTIVTTAEEIQGYELVKAIVSDVVDPDRVTIWDATNYCSVRLDGNMRRAICRMHFNVPNRKGLAIFGAERDQTGRRVVTFHRIESVNDIANFADDLKAIVRIHLGGEPEV